MASMLTAAHEEWVKIHLEMFRNFFKYWLVLAIPKAQGHHALKY
jgi:hypothetical protein